jgi:hypothetical protein
VFETRLLLTVFGAKREEVAEGGWRRLHNEKLHDLNTSQNNIEITKSNGIR